MNAGDQQSQIEVFLQDFTEVTLLYSNSSQVIDHTYDNQASDYKELDDEHDWISGSDHADIAPVSAYTDNTNYACYFAEELTKVGRNPNDFNNLYDIHIGVRLYADDTSTDFIDLGTQYDYLDQGEPAEYDNGESPDSAISLFSSLAAAIMVLFALNF